MTQLELLNGDMAEVQGFTGLHLTAKVHREDNVQFRLIGEMECKDKAAFWRVWKERGGGSVTLEDGEEWDPSML